MPMADAPVMVPRASAVSDTASIETSERKEIAVIGTMPTVLIIGPTTMLLLTLYRGFSSEVRKVMTKIVRHERGTTSLQLRSLSPQLSSIIQCSRLVPPRKQVNKNVCELKFVGA